MLLSFIKLAAAQDTTKVLFIGNSFTSQNNLPNLFLQLSQSSGENVIVASHMPGGISVGDTSQGTSAHMNNPLVYSLIKSNNWDYLVLQDNQGRFCLGYGQFPASSSVIEGHLKIRDSLKFYHPCAHMIWYAGFGPKNGYPPYGNTGEALIDSIYHNYQFLNDTAREIIAPIGPAFQRIIAGHPSINLWDTDNTHPSLNGSLLIASIIHTTIFKKSPILCSYNPGLLSNVDSLLKNTAYQTTIDSLDNTGLINITPPIVQTGNILSIAGYSNYLWYVNDSLINSSNNSTTISQTGNYYCLVTDNMGCMFKTLEQNYIYTGLAENSTNKVTNLDFYPNPVINQNYFIINNPFKKIVQARIYSPTGAIVLNSELKSGLNKINLSGLQSGVYFIITNSDSLHTIDRLIIENH